MAKKISDTTSVILAAAAQRDNLAILPFPETVKAKGAAVKKVLDSMARQGFTREIEDGPRGMLLVVTDTGLEAIGIEVDEGATEPQEAPVASPSPSDSSQAAAADVAPVAAGGHRKTRVGTKQAKIIDLMSRPGGATLAELMDATDWQPHTVRGAISGTLRKRLGLTVITDRVRVTGEKGSMTHYRIPYTSRGE